MTIVVRQGGLSAQIAVVAIALSAEFSQLFLREDGSELLNGFTPR